MIRRPLVFFILIHLILAPFSHAAETDSRFMDDYDQKKPAAAPKTKPAPSEKSEYDILNLNYWWGYVTDTGDIVLSPLHWKLKDCLIAGAVVGGTVGLFFADQSIRDWSQDHRSHALDTTADIFNTFGDGYVLLPAMGVGYGVGWFFKDEKIKKTALLSLESFALTGLFNTSIKVLTQRHRPGEGISSDDWYGSKFTLKNYRLSFPSGHTSTAFAIATVIASEYDNVWFVPPLAYSLATMVGLARIESDKHWASDVFFAAALGYFTAKAVVHRHPNKKKKTDVAVLPFYDRANSGLKVVCRF